MSHKCPGPGEVHSQGGIVDDDMLACSRHWYQADASTRNRVYRTWSARQREGTDAAVTAHLVACSEAVAQMSELPKPKAQRAGGGRA